MKAFKATHVIEYDLVEKEEDKKETVLVIEVLKSSSLITANAVFVRSDGTMDVDEIQYFKNCEPDWREQ